MSRKAKTIRSTALATVESALPVLQITRAEANARIKARALELYNAARTQRDEHIRAFEAEYGRADRIDHTVLADLQRIQARLAAIAARQQRANATGGEPKVAKFVDQLGMMIGAVRPISPRSARSSCLRLSSKPTTSVGMEAALGPRVRTMHSLPTTRSSTIRSALRTPPRLSIRMVRCACTPRSSRTKTRRHATPVSTAGRSSDFAARRRTPMNRRKKNRSTTAAWRPSRSRQLEAPAGPGNAPGPRSG